MRVLEQKNKSFFENNRLVLQWKRKYRANVLARANVASRGSNPVYLECYSLATELRGWELKL